MKNIFSEMRRRNIFRVAGSYAVIGWIIMQVIAVMTPALNLPDWLDSFFALLIIAGFPIALFFAWAFELTPEGVKRTEEVVDGQTIRPQTLRKLDLAILAAVALVAFLIVGTSLRSLKAASPAAIDGAAQRSVAAA